MSDVLSGLGLQPVPANRDDHTPVAPGTSPEAALAAPAPAPAAPAVPVVAATAPAAPAVPAAPAAPEPVLELSPAEEAVVAQADKPDAVRALIEAERKKARDAYAKARDLESAELARLEAEKPTEVRLAEAEQRAQAEALKNLKLTVGVTKGLALDLCDRLVGTSVEDLAADADKLLSGLKPATPTPEPTLPVLPALPGGLNGGFQTPPPAAPVDPGQSHNALILGLLRGTQQ